MVFAKQITMGISAEARLPLDPLYHLILFHLVETTTTTRRRQLRPPREDTALEIILFYRQKVCADLYSLVHWNNIKLRFAAAA